MDLRPKNARILKQLFYKNVETSHIPAVHPYSCIIYTLLNKDNQNFHASSRRGAEARKQLYLCVSWNLGEFR